MINPIIPVALTIPTDFKTKTFTLCSIKPNTYSTLALIFDFLVLLLFVLRLVACCDILFRILYSSFHVF